MAMALHIRPAEPADLERIVEFTTGTFPWGDYVPAAFLNWLETPNSVVLVGLAEGSPVGIVRAVMLSERELWLHAARVDPAHRRRGHGKALNVAGQEWGRRRGAQVARLMVEDWNTAPQHQVRELGFRQVARWFHASRQVPGSKRRPGGPGLREPEPLRIAPGPDAEGAYASWSTSVLARAGHGLIGVRWHMRSMRIEDLTSAAAGNRMWESPAGWITIEVDDGHGAWVSWLMTTASEADNLIETTLTKLRGDGIETVEVLLPRVPWLISTMESAGFDVHPNTVWEVPL
jgi:ribosomal protein S18 acetylase RimI-like enzyme